ncbi:hypothetical protein CLV58_109242 [Spirosoma oryzae]|uniref:Uncharacterized protein n=1 Tax=Spirosoma oryzae TaxID=1469603 RepID=A0A2T0SYN2_9BACT|nr:hypothetical protein [Spirosoma oryzae]PRY38515.1 hypothetical protein CLV58_109242 [Spirosoma oryzae]
MKPLADKIGKTSSTIYLDTRWMEQSNPALGPNIRLCQDNPQGTSTETIAAPEPYRTWIKQAYQIGRASVSRPLNQAVQQILDMADIYIPNE